VVALGGQGPRNGRTGVTPVANNDAIAHLRMDVYVVSSDPTTSGCCVPIQRTEDNGRRRWDLIIPRAIEDPTAGRRRAIAKDGAVALCAPPPPPPSTAPPAPLSCAIPRDRAFRNPQRRLTIGEATATPLYCGIARDRAVGDAQRSATSIGEAAT